MTTTAKIILDSVSPDGARITTMQLRYPRFVHSEFMTHRAFSRNASSSRAIPVGRLIQDVIDDPVVPSFWGKNQKGMQAREELDEHAMRNAQIEWAMAREGAVRSAQLMNGIGAHKQIVNRLLEPFAHINVIVTATEWDNFFRLRMHEDAQPEIRELAEAMYAALNASKPTEVNYGDWHVPYITSEDHFKAGVNSSTPDSYELLRRVSVARCARVSYLTHEGSVPDFNADLRLYEQLATSGHWSPFEHQAKADVKIDLPGYGDYYQEQDHHGNFTGWIQHRKLLEK